MSRMTARILAVSLFVVMLVLDQLTKVWVTARFELYERVELLSFLNFTYVRNEGAAWGMFSGAQYALVVIGFLAMILCTIFWKRFIGKEAIFLPLGGVLYAGIVGNIIDRLRVNYVIDFIDVHFGDWHYPCFNVADIAICLSVIGIIVLQFYIEFQAKKKVTS